MFLKLSNVWGEVILYQIFVTTSYHTIKLLLISMVYIKFVKIVEWVDNLCAWVLQPLFITVQGMMNQNFRIVECLSKPTPIFCIYDYTKIAYLTDHYICTRDILAKDTKPTFIKLNHSTDHPTQQIYFGLAPFPNLLVLAQKAATKDIYLHFYSMQEEQQIKVYSQLAKRSDHNNQFRYQMHSSCSYVYLVVHRNTDSQIIIVNTSTRQVVCRGFTTWNMLNFRAKAVENMELFSVVQAETNQIVQFQVITSKNEEKISQIAEKGRWVLPKNGVYSWSRDELLIGVENKISVLLEGRELQGFEGVKNLKTIVSLSNGFIAVTNSSIRIYRKSANIYDFQGEYRLKEVPTSGLELSPQEDILAFYNHKTSTIYWSANWQTAERRPNARELPLQKIQMIKEDTMRTYNSQQALFAVSTGSILNIYSPITYNSYLSMRTSARQSGALAQKRKLTRAATLVSDKMLNQMSQGEPIETVGLHPSKNIIAVAFKNSIKIYLVLYNDFKVLKQLPLSHCREVGFNTTGSVLHAKLGGKQGSKIYLYNTQSNYDCIQILNTSRPVVNLIWTPFDTAIYGIHQNGFYTWNLSSMFKQKYDSTHSFSFEIKGACMSTSSIIIWGYQNIVELDFSHNIIETVKLFSPIDQLLLQKGQIIFTSAKGDLYKCKSITIVENVMLSPGFKLQPACKLYSVKGNTVLCLNSNGNIVCLEWGIEESTVEVVSIDRKIIKKFQQSYKEYEEEIGEVNDKLDYQLEILREQFEYNSQKQRREFELQFQDRQDRDCAARMEKIRLEEQMQETMDKHEQDILKHIRQLQRIYERKLALMTNKLLTSEEMGFRSHLEARESLAEIQEKHSHGIQQVRKQYSKELQKEINSRSGVKEEILNIKKQYQTRLSQLQIQNEELIKKIQNTNDGQIISLKKNVVNFELKYTEAISKKLNIEKKFDHERILMEQLKFKNQSLQQRLNEELRRGEKQTSQNVNMENQLIEKDEVIACLEQRITELQKSNEIFKYRIIEIKSISDPKQQQILKLKDNMVQLEQQFDKISKKAHDHQQNISFLKKDNTQLKNNLNATTNRQKKIQKNYHSLLDKLKQTTKMPIQEIRKSLLKVLEEYDSHGEVKVKTQKVKDSPLDQLNRVRDHLEICLKQAVQAGRKNQNQKESQVQRKNKENSELLREINDLRVKVNDLESKLRQKDKSLQDIRRERRTVTSASKAHRQPSSTHMESAQVDRRHTRESFFEKSLFRGHWKQKRLKTEQGSRKKSNQSYIRHQTNNLLIQTRHQDVQDLKRMLQQKELIIKQLINKIHKLS